MEVKAQIMEICEEKKDRDYLTELWAQINVWKYWKHKPYKLKSLLTWWVIIRATTLKQVEADYLSRIDVTRILNKCQLVPKKQRWGAVTYMNAWEAGMRQRQLIKCLKKKQIRKDRVDNEVGKKKKEVWETNKEIKVQPCHMTW